MKYDQTQSSEKAPLAAQITNNSFRLETMLLPLFSHIIAFYSDMANDPIEFVFWLLTTFSNGTKLISNLVNNKKKVNA